jgi:hypothetical protein
MTPIKEKPFMPDDAPPFLGTWRRVYIFVLCYLTVLITIFYFFTRAFAP